MTETSVHPPLRAGRRKGAHWRDHAACRDVDPELFFPAGNAGPALLQIAQAKPVCAACPARLPCLDWAMASHQEAGVWGGTSEDERRILQRRRR
jgi:WhiB family transcriptional regulator, redox-sensing transcriptional regulator